MQGILFDLDGTLLDTAKDLNLSLNRVLQSRQLPPLDPVVTRNASGAGCKGLLKLGLDIDTDHPNYSELANDLLQYYAEHLLDHTNFFPGMEEVLLALDAKQIPWGIVTNKPQRFTQPLMQHFGLDKRARCILSGDSLKQHKPHPEPLLVAANALQIPAAACWYIGDSEVDVQASKAAGMTMVLAMYGYITADDHPAHWGADKTIQQPQEILQFF